jgi:acyl carrier protein
MDQIIEKVVATIREICSPATPDLSDTDRPLFECGLDSMDYAGALLEIEDRFSVHFTSQDMEDLNTVNKIVSLIKAKQAASQ